MANMSYCRFENTLADLRDCESALSEGDDDDMSEEEEKAKKRLIRLCIEIAKDYGPDPVSNTLFALPPDALKVT